MKPHKFTVEWTASNGRRSRVEYYRDPSGGYTRHVEERRAGSWRTVGTEPISELDVDGEMHAGGAGAVNRGP